MAKRVVTKREKVLWFVFMGLYYAGIIALIVYGLGHPELINDTPSRVFVSSIFFLFGLGYWLFTSKISPVAIGWIQIIAAIGINYYQLVRIGSAQNHMEIYDRFVFILGGIALVVNGFKTMEKSDDEKKRKELATSLSGDSPA
jgi:hypothetical protein